MNQHSENDRAELEAHFAERMKAYLELGETPEEAAISALRKFGGQEAILKELRQQRQAARFRQVIAIVGMGALWGAVWPVLFSLMLAAIGLLTRSSTGEDALPIVAIISGVGFFSGSAFGMILLLAERGKRFTEISRGRVALWGMLAGALFPLLTNRANQTLWTCVFGVIVSVTLLVFAQKKRRSLLSHLLQCLLGPVKSSPLRKTG